MKQFLLGVVTSIMMMIVTVAGYLKLGFAEVRADVNPPSWERALMSSVVYASVRREAPTVTRRLSILWTCQKGPHYCQLRNGSHYVLVR